MNRWVAALRLVGVGFFIGGSILLGVVAGLEVLYAWMPRLAALTTDGRVAALDLDGEGSLAVWFSSTTLSLAALAAILVYSVRRHKKDDYHGHYRIWLWAAMCWGLMSIDETSSLHEGFKELMAHASGTRMFRGPRSSRCAPGSFTAMTQSTSTSSGKSSPRTCHR